MRSLLLTFDCMYCNQKGKISQNFVAFSEYMNFKSQKNEKLALKLGIQTYQILTNDDEVCIPSLSSIFLGVFYNHVHTRNIDFRSNFLLEISLLNPVYLNIQKKKKKSMF